MVMDDKEAGTDFHFVRQDDDGKWSHKQGHGPVKNTDDGGKEITDPEKAKIDNYKICGYYCVCPDVEVAQVPAGGTFYASLALKENARLTATSLDVTLPKGRFTLLREEPLMPAKPGLTVSAAIYSGEPDPHWDLDKEEIETVRKKLHGLRMTERRPDYKMGYRGFHIFNTGIKGLPNHIHVFAGLLSMTYDGEPAQWYEDSNRLERWLITKVRFEPFGKEVLKMIGERKVSRKQPKSYPRR